MRAADADAEPEYNSWNLDERRMHFSITTYTGATAEAAYEDTDVVSSTAI